MISFLFDITFVVALPFWILMILLPHWSWTRRIIASPWIVLPPMLIYSFVVVITLQEAIPALLQPGLEGMGARLGTPEGTLGAWSHFIAFDLFAGRWAYLDSRKRRISAWLMGPILFLIIMFGPAGLLVHLLVRPRFPERRDATEPVPAPAG